MIVSGPGFTTSLHRHHCVQLLMTLRGSVLVRGERGKAWKRCGAVWVRPDAPHQIDARGNTLVIVFISAESEAGAALFGRMKSEIASVSARQVARWRAILGSRPTDARVERWLTMILPRAKRVVAIDPRVARVLSYLQEERNVFDDRSLKTLAGIAGLSPSRFMHAFTESIGVPVRPYILWLRLQRAACDLMDGASVTSAAHHAGFSDGAHMTRTFRRMLGATPSELALQKRLRLGFSVEQLRRKHGVALVEGIEGPILGATDPIQS